MKKDAVARVRSQKFVLQVPTGFRANAGELKCLQAGEQTDRQIFLLQMCQAEDLKSSRVIIFSLYTYFT